MRAVWSFWTLPCMARTGRTWPTPLHHLLAWGISFHAARRHYPDTVLVTDRAGKKLLVDDLGLPFSDVSTELDHLEGADPAWWALGKLIAYSLQDQPFVHLDTDVFLWKALPAELTEAPVFAQCPEYVSRFQRRSSEIENLFSEAHADLPVEWQWAVSRDDAFIREENCGILGGSRTDFIRHYSMLAAGLILQPEYAGAWSRCREKSNMVMEQFLLSACVDYHRFHPDSPWRGVAVRYLFPSLEDAMNPAHSGRAGFTHLLGDSKSAPGVARRMEERMKREDMAFFRRCEKVAARAAWC